MSIIQMFMNNVIDKKLSKDAKDKRVNLNCQTLLIWHEKSWLIYLWTKVQWVGENVWSTLGVDTVTCL